MSTVAFAEVRTPRPSDPTELCCILDSSDEGMADIVHQACTTGAEVAAKLAAGSTHIVGTPEAFEQYIESDAAVRNTHLWLT